MLRAICRLSAPHRPWNRRLPRPQRFGQERLALELLEKREVLSSVTWGLGPDLPASRTDAVAILGPDTDVAILGGSATVLQLSASATNWATGHALDTSLKSPGAVTTSHGAVYVYGGMKGTSVSEEGWSYDYYGGDHQNIASLNTPRGNFGATVDALDRAYAIGGLDDNNRVTSTVERYNSATDEWVFVSSLPTPRQNAATVNDPTGHIFLFGGQSGVGTAGIAANSYRFDVDAGVWSSVAPMPIGTIDSAAVYAPDDHIYVIGGRTVAGAIANVQVYDPVANTWEVGTDLPAARYNHAAAVDSLGRIVVAAGTSADGTAMSSVVRSQRLDVPEVVPIIVSSPLIQGSLDSYYTYDVQATGNPEPTYSLVSAPTGMTIDLHTGLVAWQPTEGQVGDQAVTIRAENRVGSIDQSFVIHVLADTIAPTAPTSLTITSANTNTVTLSWNSSSDNRGVDHYELLEGFRSGWRGRNTTYRVIKTGITATTATIDGLLPLSSHKYAVQAVDTAGNKSLRSNVVVASTQSAPILRYFADGYINSTVSAKANFPLRINLSASANPAPIFSLVEGPESMSVHPTTGVLDWLPSATDVGTKLIIVSASNSVGTSQLTIPITVAADLPLLSLHFNPNSGGSGNATAGLPFEMQVIDTSHTPSTFALLAGPAGMTIDPQSGILQWMPTAADAGQTTVTIRATNSAGTADATRSFETFFVGAPSNIQMTMLTALHPTATWEAPSGVGVDEIAGYDLLAVARYRTGRFMKTHSVRVNVPGNQTSVEIAGLLTGKNYTLYVNAYNLDGERGAVAVSAAGFTPAPALPVISWSVFNPNGTALVAGQPVHLQLTNSHSDPAVYTVVQGPPGLTLDPHSGLASWLPSPSDIGATTIILRATNSVGNRDVSVSFEVLFSGPVANASAVKTADVAQVTWSAPLDNVAPVESYQITMQWRWSGRLRTRSITVPATQLSASLALIPTGAVWHQGVYITPIDGLGRRGATSPLIPYSG